MHYKGLFGQASENQFMFLILLHRTSSPEHLGEIIVFGNKILKVLLRN